MRRFLGTLSRGLTSQGNSGLHAKKQLLPPPELQLPLNQKRSYFVESEEDKAKEATERERQLQIKKDEELKEFEERCRKDEENLKRYAKNQLEGICKEYEATQKEFAEKVGKEVINGRIIYWPGINFEKSSPFSGPSTLLFPGVKIGTYADGVGVFGFSDSGSYLTGGTHASHEGEDAALEDSVSYREASQPEIDALVYTALMEDVGIKRGFCTNESVGGFGGSVCGVFLTRSSLGLIKNSEFQEFLKKIKIDEEAEVPLYLYDERGNFRKIENGEIATEPAEFENVISAKTIAENTVLSKEFLNLFIRKLALQCILHPELPMTQTIENGDDCDSAVNCRLFDLVQEERRKIRDEHRQTCPTASPSSIHQVKRKDSPWEDMSAVFTH